MGKTRRAGVIVGVAALVVLLVLGGLGLAAWSSVSTLRAAASQAGDAASQAQTSFTSGDLKTALSKLDEAGDHIEAAYRESRTPIWDIASMIPYYGSDVRAVRGILSAANDASVNALPKIRSAAEGTIIDFSLTDLFAGTTFENGTLSIPKIASVKRDLNDAGTVMKRVRSTIRSLPETHVPELTDMVGQATTMVEQIDEAFTTINDVVSRIPG